MSKKSLTIHNDHHILTSVRRYVRYCVISECQKSSVKILLESMSFFILNNSCSSIPDWHRFEQVSLKETQFCFLGFDEYCDVNLLDLDNLKPQLLDCLQPKNPKRTLAWPVFNKHLASFFKEHGEQSLISGLNDLYQLWGNYKGLLDSGVYKLVDLNERYLIPGVELLDKLEKRFKCTSPLLRIVGWEEEVTAISNKIDSVRDVVGNLQEGDSSLMPYVLEAVKDITEIVEHMEQELIKHRISDIHDR